MRPLFFMLFFLPVMLSCAGAEADEATLIDESIPVDTEIGKVDEKRYTVPVAQSQQQQGAEADDAQVANETIDTRHVQPNDLVSFAQTLLGTPYKYASVDPAKGFDCSGFITYIFNHFNIKVPRSSKDFTHVGREVKVADAKPGDLILFTGTDSTVRVVGHMGLIIQHADTLKFIHSSSGKAMGVTVSPLVGYYQTRFVKVIRIFDSIR